jgi:hypothetical protein
LRTRRAQFERDLGLFLQQRANERRQLWADAELHRERCKEVVQTKGLSLDAQFEGRKVEILAEMEMLKTELRQLVQTSADSLRELRIVGRSQCNKLVLLCYGTPMPNCNIIATRGFFHTGNSNIAFI